MKENRYISINAFELMSFDEQKALLLELNTPPDNGRWTKIFCKARI